MHETGLSPPTTGVIILSNYSNIVNNESHLKHCESNTHKDFIDQFHTSIIK